MIKRILHKKLLILADKFPVIAVVGPRQSGKTTLSQLAFPNHTYLSLEDHKIRALALEDPHSFFKMYQNEHGIILDEIQEAPALLSYIQIKADAEKKLGYFILTGSQNFLVNEAITQTLAGRIAICTLLPCSISELQEAKMLPATIEQYVFQGQYPSTYARNITMADWYPNYIRTYVERDVRTLRNVIDLSIFKTFMGLCAGRIGQLLNVSSLANDCGISEITANAWLSI